MLKKVLILLPVVFLAACGGAPSESDIQASLQKLVDQQNSQLEKMAGSNSMAKGMTDGLKVSFKNVKKIGCKEDGEKAYICDVEAETAMGGSSAGKNVMPIRFVKGSEGWMATK